jgi:hypothetical protein
MENDSKKQILNLILVSHIIIVSMSNDFGHKRANKHDVKFARLLPNAAPAFNAYDHIVAAAHGTMPSQSYGAIGEKDHIPSLRYPEFAEVFPLICGQGSPSSSREVSSTEAGRQEASAKSDIANALKMTDTGELWIILLAVLPLGRQFIDDFGHQAFIKCFDGASAGLRQIKQDLERLVACAGCGPSDCTSSSKKTKTDRPQATDASTVDDSKAMPVAKK